MQRDFAPRLPNFNELDERLAYLLKEGKIFKSTDDFSWVLAEISKLPGVLVFYRKESERSKNPDL